MPTRPSDEDLVRASRGGDPDAFGLLVERHMTQMYALAYRLTGSHHDADDLAQETFIRAHRGLARFRGEASFSTWLTRILLNLSRNPRRSHAALDSRPEPAAPDPDPLDEALSEEKKLRLRRAVAGLPRRQRESVLLRLFAGLRYDEIAAAMGISIGTAKANVFHALKKLALRLGSPEES
jgi:RNA polymerase sigma-70 factor (ECF subfamily)